MTSDHRCDSLASAGRRLMMSSSDRNRVLSLPFFFVRITLRPSDHFASQNLFFFCFLFLLGRSGRGSGRFG